MGIQLELWTQHQAPAHRSSPVSLAIRESRRARQLILQALPPRTVEIVVPQGMRSEIVQQFIREHRSWIDRAGAEMLEAYPEPELKPGLIELAALDAQVAVRYFDADTERPCYRYHGHELKLYCAEPSHADSPLLLRRWLLEQGRRWLRPWLIREAARIDLAPRTIQIRLQKTRWGSCSASGRISINAALLLVPPELARYLFVHELCHLAHLSHSRRYWQTVARHEPGYRELDRRLAASWRELPAWVFTLTRGGCG
jgi:predicted metal-dependent hydrolase